MFLQTLSCPLGKILKFLTVFLQIHTLRNYSRHMALFAGYQANIHIAHLCQVTSHLYKNKGI